MVDNSDERTRSAAFVEMPAPGEARLMAFWDGGSRQTVLRPGMRLLVGRSQETDFRIDHPSVSRKHLVVHYGPPASVEDLGSANSIRVSGEKLAPNSSRMLGPADTVEFGGAMLLVQQAEVRSDAGATPGGPSARVAMSPAMQSIDKLIELVAKSSLSVILLGETGVGKDVTATRIHNASTRAKGPILRINCAALPETLLESELFGYEKGAFTGAVKSKIGLLETASGGTLFLDEVGEMPMVTQAKLLRVLEQREVLPVGALRARPIDVRFVSATNRDLPTCIAQGTFRQDLYFRLNGIQIHVPPLRERREEILGLALRFASEYGTQAGMRGVQFSTEAQALLMSYAFPGNIRELRNMMERAVVLCGGSIIRPEHLHFELPLPQGAPLGSFAPPPSPSFAPPPVPQFPGAQTPYGGVPAAAPPSSARGLRTDVEAFERDRIVAALEACHGNQTQAAKMLGISRRTLVSRLDSLSLPRPRKGKE
jgi:DNA-binding NtrC family response regulator